MPRVPALGWRLALVVALIGGAALVGGRRILVAGADGAAGLFVPTPRRTAPILPLAVLAHGPGDRVRDRQPLKVRFDRPVVALGDEPAGAVLRLDPAVTGRERWVAPDLLVFEPDDPWPRATRFTARVEGTFAALDGARLAAPLAWTFESVRPRCTVAPNEPTLGPRDGYLVECSAPLDPASLAAAVEVRVDGRPLPVVALRLDRDPAAQALPPDPFGVRTPYERRLASIGSERRTRTLLVKSEVPWPAGRRLTIRVGPALRSLEGPLGPEEPATFEPTVAPLPRLLAARCTPHGVEVDLSTRLDLARAREALGTSPPLPHGPDGTMWLEAAAEARGGPRTGPWVLRLAEGRPGQAYEVRSGPALRDEVGQPVPPAALRTGPCPPPPPKVALAPDPGTLPPAGSGQIGVVARALDRARLRAVVLDDALLAGGGWRWTEADLWDATAAGEDGRGRRPTEPVPLEALGRPVIERWIRLDARGGTPWSAAAVDLDAITGALRRPVLVEVDADAGRLPDGGGWPRRGIYERTDLGVIGWHSPVGSALLVQSFASGRPVAGAVVEEATPRGLVPVGRTDARGIAWLPPLEAVEAARDDRHVLLVRGPAGQDVTLVETEGGEAPGAREAPNGSAGGLRPYEAPLGELVPDRDLYAPGETIRFVGWAAIAAPQEERGVRALPAGSPARVTLERDGIAAAQAAVTFDAHGKIWGALTLPRDARPGRYALRAALTGAAADGDRRDDVISGPRIVVADVRPDAFDLTVSADRRELLPGRRLNIDVKARSFSGGAARLARVEARATCRYGRHHGADRALAGPRSEKELAEDRFEAPPWLPGAADPPGRARLVLAPPPPRAERPRHCDVTVVAWDLTRQARIAEISATVHPTDRYVELAPELPRAREGEALRVRVRVTAAAARRRLAVPVRVRLEPSDEGGAEGRRAIERLVRATAAARPTEISFDGLPRGSYRLTATTSTPDGPARSEVEARVYEPSPRTKPVFEPLAEEDEEPEPFVEIEAPPEARVRGTAVVRVEAPRGATEGTLVVVRDRVREVHRLRFRRGRARLTLAVGEGWVPGVGLEAAVVVPRRDGPQVVAHAASEPIAVPPDHRALRVAIEAPARARPGAPVDVGFTVRDAAGRPVPGARVAAWAVDEAVLSLTGYEPPDLTSAFAPGASLDPSFFETFARLRRPFVLPTEDPFAGGGGSLGKGGGGGSSGGRRERDGGELRQRFETTPFFVGDLPTDAAGRGRASFVLPHALTTFRITAIASAPLDGGAAPARFGEGRRPIEVSLPLQLQPIVAPRLRPGDGSEAVVLVRNRTGARAEIEVTVSLDPGAPAALRMPGPTRASIALSAGEDRRVSFPLLAEAPGQARVRLSARVTSAPDPSADAVELPVVVEPDAPVRDVAIAAGSLAAGETLRIPARLPASAARPEARGTLTLELAPDPTAARDEAVAALRAYPHGCAEQSASQLLAELFVPPGGEAGAAAQARVRALVRRFERFWIDREAGLAMWPDGRSSWPLGSAWAAFALARAARAGLPEAKPLLDRLAAPLSRWVGRDDARDGSIDRTPPLVRALSALALAEAGRAPPRAALEPLLARPGSVAAALAAVALARSAPGDPRLAAFASRLARATSERPLTAHLHGAAAEPGAPVASDVLVEAASLWALLAAGTEPAAADKLLRGLVEHRRRGGFGSTFENALVLLAFEARRPPSGAAAPVRAEWQADGRPLGTTVLRPTSPPARQLLPLARLPAPFFDPSASPGTLVARATGSGRAFYAVTATFDAGAAAADRGIGVATRFVDEAGNTGAEVPLALGGLVRVEVRLTARDRLDQIAVEVPLPAGLEPLEPAVGDNATALTRKIAGDELRPAHVERHRDRLFLYFDHLPPGRHRVTTFARALVPGRYRTPGARAEGMYAPDVRGWEAERVVGVAPEAP